MGLLTDVWTAMVSVGASVGPTDPDPASSDLLREIAYENAILMKLELENYRMALLGRAMDASRYAFAVRRQSGAGASAGQKVVAGNVVSQSP